MAIHLDAALMFADQRAATRSRSASGRTPRRASPTRRGSSRGGARTASSDSSTSPTESAALDELRRFADGVGQAFSDVVVLGIGGSALGAKLFRGALRPPAWNAMSDEAREYFPRLHVMDNIDPAELLALFGRIELARTLFLVISKSGGTVETLAQYLVVRERLEQAIGAEYRRHLVFITDPEQGPLRAIARAEGIVSMDVPPNVGGRYSALSPVGLLPAALIGVDVARPARGRRGDARALRGVVAGREPGGEVRAPAVARRQRARDADARDDAVRRRAPRIHPVVRAALGGEPRQAARGRPLHRPDAARRDRRHRPAQPAPALSSTARATRR